MDEKHEALSESKHHTLGKYGLPQSIEWYSRGQTRVFEVEGVRIAVRYVGGKGRRGRIAVVASADRTNVSTPPNDVEPTVTKQTDSPIRWQKN